MQHKPQNKFPEMGKMRNFIHFLSFLCGVTAIYILVHVWTASIFQHDWHAPNSPCEKKQRIVFIKVHKAGSSTVTTILQRFALTYNLSVALPNKPLHSFRYNYFGKENDVLKSEDILPPSLKGNRKYDIICNHVIYNQSTFDRIFTTDMFNLAILRNPLEHFISVFRYYGMTREGYFKKLFNYSSNHPASVFLQSPLEFEPTNARFSFTNNRQIIDLGMLPHLLKNTREVKTYVDFLKNRFDLVMIMEYFDESLILLKRKLCWSFKDIFYYPKNKNWNNENLRLSLKDLDLHRQWSSADFILYKKLLEEFWLKIRAENNEFHEEVLFFKYLQSEVKAYCNENHSSSPFVVPKSKWDNSFEVTIADCLLLKKSETELLDKLYDDLYGIVHETASMSYNNSNEMQ